jgi:NADH:ubiquinone oxidoreductase subunit K
MFRGSSWIIGLVLAVIFFIAANGNLTKRARRQKLARLGTALLALGVGLVAPGISHDSAANWSFVAACIALATGAVVIGLAHRGR